MNLTPTDLWNQASARLQQLVAPQTFKRWFEPIQISHIRGDCVQLKVGGQLYRYWLEDNYGDLLKETLSSIAGKPLTLEFVSGSEPASEAPPPPTPAPAQRHAVASVLRSELTPAFTFENFVVGPSNQYAHAGCWAVAQSPGRTYNPLFIYGATGLGKTHLMHAVGQFLLSQNKSARVAYVSTERFVNEFIDAIQNKRWVPFRKKYRSCDILLIDDIHFLSRGDQIQEEFFHTFNTLFEAQKQIVLSSDRPATEIANLEQRLVGRFEWGLTVQLQPPDEETRIAILRKKQEKSQVPVSDEIVLFLAKHIKTNIRRLEGAWAKVWFTTKLKGRPLSIGEVETELLDILIEESKQAVTTESIQKRVASYYDIRIADMTSKRRQASIAFPRQVAMYLCRTMTRASLNEIGDAFGGRDHGTVLHACRLIEQRLKTDAGLKQAVNQLTKQLTY
ncbi:MAG: chromosomal replication initiator protein DnaA [Verrucomicrobiae bacterium]|nr:chromosomal replication initiator protein DnaA [Verrucomicrobiae bacterium]